MNLPNQIQIRNWILIIHTGNDMRRNTLKYNAESSRKRITDYRNCKPMRIFKMIRHLVEANGGHASVVYQDGYMHNIPQISRKGNDCGKVDEDITLASFTYLYKLRYVASRSKIPSMKFMKQLGIYAHNTKRRYNA